MDTVHRSFSIFISFKNHDRGGGFTRDREIAEGLYKALVARGAQVFFSLFTLKELGQAEYKRAINEALDQASVLVVVGTNPDNVRSRWVEYEWSSFHDDILSGRKPNGTIIGYIEGISSNDLPRELRSGYEMITADQTSLDEAAGFIVRCANERICQYAEDGTVATDSYNHMSGKEPEQPNIDRELEELYRQILGDEATGDVSDANDPMGIRSILRESYISGFMSSFAGNNEHNLVQSSQFAEDKGVIEIITLSKDETSEKHFSIIDKKDSKTLVFEVYECVDFDTETRFYQPELLDSTVEDLGDGKCKRTYYVEDAQPLGNQLIFISFMFSDNVVLTNLGLLKGDEVRLTHNPAMMELGTEKTDSFGSNQVSSLGKSMFTCSKMRGEEVREVFLRYSAAVSPDVPVIIDTTDASLVLRKLEWDELKNEYSAHIDIVPNRYYYALRIADKQSGRTRTPLSEFEIATYYLAGSYGFPRDIMRACEHFQNDGSAEALLGISHAFSATSGYKNETLANRYLQLAADAGCDSAIVELAVRCIAEGSFASPEGMGVYEKLVSVSEGNCKPASLLLAYCMEKGIPSDIDLQQSFDLYLRLAQYPCNYRPAQMRLDRYWSKRSLSDNELWILFEKSVESPDGMGEFCVGDSLLYGSWLFHRDEVSAVTLLEKSAAYGSLDAAYELFRLYSDESSAYYNQKRATELSILLCGVRHSKHLSIENWLVDGHSLLNSVDADALAFKSLMEATADDADNSALNNLGWMYLHGRGCLVDYALAKTCFERAIRAGSVMSMYHLGRLYEQGFGVPIDIDRAISLYHDAAEKGCKPAKTILERNHW